MKRTSNKIVNSYRGLTSFVTRFVALVAVFLSFTTGLNAQTQVTMDMVWVGSTANTADFDVILTNTGTNSLKFNGVVFRGNHAANLTTAGGAISWAPLNNNTISEWNNWPNLSVNCPYTPATRLMNYSSNNVFFTSANAPTIPTGTGVNIGRFRMTVTGGTWLPNGQFGFTFATTAAVIAYVNGATTTTSLNGNGTTIIKTVSASQPLNTVVVSGPTASVLSGGGTICAGGTSNISVAITGGTSPFSVVYNDGTSDVTVPGYVSGTSIPVSPASTTTYTLVSVTDAGSNLGTGNSGTATVTVNSAATGSESQTACDSYTWGLNGTTYTTSGAYNHTIVGGAANGCDSIVTLNLTINNSTTVTDNQTACDSYTWALNGTTYTTSGSYTHVGTNAAGCTETTTLNLTINNSTTVTDNQTACDSYTWALNGTTYTTSGSYTHVGTNAAGCTETTTLNLTINNSTTASVSATACGSYTWALNGTTYTTSGSYTHVGTNAAGCTETTTLNLTINSNAAGSESQTACDSYTWGLNSTTYTTSGTYNHTIVGGAANGCDSIVTLNLTINNSTTVTDNQTACDSYTWALNGTTYTTSGSYTHVGTNAAGCTETTTLNLTINNSTTVTDNQTACDSYTWALNGTTYTTSGSYTHVGTNAAGCTETTTLNLTINNSTTVTDNQTACDSYTWALNGTTYTTSGSYTHVGTNAAGCPETTTLNLTINNSTSSTVNVTSCGSYTWPLSGLTYSGGGVYTHVGTNAAGCTETTTLNLTVNTGTLVTDVITSCGAYTWIDGNTYTSSNNTASFFEAGAGANGCGILHLLDLTINTVGTPSNVDATNVTSVSALVTWDAMSLPVGGFFSIQYQIFPGGSWISGGTAPAGATSALITGLTSGTLYEVQVAGNCDAMNAGAWSASGFFTTISSSCSSPIVMSVSNNTGNAVTTTWTAVPGAGWYEFRYKESSSATWINAGTLGGSATTKVFSGLLPATSYDFEARTFCPNGLAGAWSATLTETTGALSGCALPPASVASVVTGTSATITWTVVSGAGWYEFRYKPQASATWISGGTAGPSATSKTFNSLMMNTAYDFEARTICTNGIPSAWGAITFTTTGLSGCELPPVLNMTAVTTNSSIQISWPAVSGAAWYSFQYKMSSSSVWINGGTAGPSATSKMYLGLVPGTSYDFQARTHCSNGIASAWSTTGTYSTTGGASTLVVNNSSKEDIVSDKAIGATANVTTVYPNPASDKVNVEIFMESASDNTTVKLMDMSGRIVRELTTSTATGVNTITLDIQELSNGMYTLMVYQNGNLLNTSKVKKN